MPAVYYLVAMNAEPPPTTPLEVVYRAIGELRPDPRNARVHPKRQVDQIAASIDEFGFTNPILIDEADQVIAGHGRLIAAKVLGLLSVPTIRLLGLNTAQVRALRIADNKIALGASWDPDLLRVELGELKALDFSLELTGFTLGEINVALAPGTDPDDEIVPAVPKAVTTREGDIWQVGQHIVGCGDCRDKSFVQEVVGLEKVDAAFLDPPYNVKIGGHAVTKKTHREFPMASGELAPAEFRTFLKEALSASSAVSRDGSVHFVCMDWRHVGDLQASADGVYDTLLNVCVWNKSNAGMGSLYRSKHELVFVYRVGARGHKNLVELGRHGRHRTNVWDYPSVNTTGGSRKQDLKLHPTVKPVALVADALQDVTGLDDLVLDTFLGSGTTLIACERIGRRLRGVELDPGYVGVALDRWSQMTGKTPVLLRKAPNS